MYGSDVGVVLAATALALIARTGWHWALFLWGLALGIVAWGLLEVQFSLIRRATRQHPVATATLASKLDARRAVLAPGGVTMGVSVGVIAAALNAAVLTAAMTALEVLFMGLPLALLPRILGRFANPEAPEQPAQ